MGSLGRSSAGAIVAAGLLFGSAAHGAPPGPGDTVEVLTDLLESLRSGDVDGYDDAADELRDDGHWLPTAGWEAVDDEDDEVLSLVWLLLEAPQDELLLFAFDQVLIERDLVGSLNELSAVDLTFLDVVDADGVTVLEVLDHRGLDISPPLRGVLNPIAANGEPPGIRLYDDALALVAGRLEREGYPVPDLDELDLATGPLPGPVAPPLGGNSPKPDTAGDAPIEENTTDADGIGSPDPGTDGQSPSEAPVATEQTPPDDGPEPANQPQADAESNDADPAAEPAMMAESSDGVDPAIVALGAVAVIAILLALFALRGNRHSGRLADIAFTDALTGLANRRRLDDDLANETRQGDRPTAVLMIDVDHFKQFNDDHGHAVGDDVLRRVADIIAANVRDVDLPYRYGGEEFSVLLPGTTHDDAQMVGERVRAAIECAHFDVDGEPVSVTASIGLSTGPATEVTQLVRRADQALYVAKDNGRNQLARG